jgi:hypothetical protein
MILFLSFLQALFIGPVTAQHVLDFFIPPCPSVGIIEEEQPSAVVRVFPQPATDELTIAFENPGKTGVGNVELSMYNIMGRLVLRETAAPGATKARLDVTAVPPGVYLLQIRMNNKYQNHRIIITRRGE